MNFDGKTGEFISPQQVLGHIDDSLLGDAEESVNVLLINEVKKYPILYDFNHEKYSDKEIRARIWARISEDLGLSAKEAKHQWKRLRDSLRDALKRQEGKMGVACRKTWRYHKKMEFVVPFMTNREATGSSGNSKRSRSRRNAHPPGHPHPDAALSMLASGSSSTLMPKAFLVQGGQGPSGLNYTGLSNPVSINFVAANGSRRSVSYGVSSTFINAQNTVQTSCSMQQRSLNASAEGSSYYNNGASASGASSSRVYKAEGVEMTLLDELSHKPLDEDLYFCLSMAATMKRLTEQRRARLKCDMMSMLYSAQCEEAFP